MTGVQHLNHVALAGEPILAFNPGTLIKRYLGLNLAEGICLGKRTAIPKTRLLGIMAFYSFN